MTAKDIIQKWNSQRIPHLSIDETQELIDEVERLQVALAETGRMLRNEMDRIPAETIGGLGGLPEPSLWMTHESKRRLKSGGNGKGAVPVHCKRSATAKIPLYTEEQMQAERERCLDIWQTKEYGGMGKSELLDAYNGAINTIIDIRRIMMKQDFVCPISQE